MPTTPKVSVVVTTYNQERYIRAALESVVMQKTPFEYEVIVADDASNDGTAAIVEEFAGRYPGRIRAIRQDVNGGDWGARNFLAGLNACRGEFIATLDGDDYWSDPGKLEVQAAFLDSRPEYQLCFHGCRVEYDSASRGGWDMRYLLPQDDVTIEEFLKAPMLHTSTIMMRQELAREVCAVRSLPKLKDCFIGVLACRSRPIHYLDRIMSVYRRHEEAIFGSLDFARQRAEFAAFYEQVRDVAGARYRDLIDRQICIVSYGAALAFEGQGDLANSREFYKRALHGDPSWLDELAVPFGLTGSALFRRAARHLRLYWLPPLFRASEAVEVWLEKVRWFYLRTSVVLRAHARLARHGIVGSLRALPNPAVPSGRGTASVQLQWTCADADIAEVRLGRPDGPLISRKGGSGTFETGEWAEDGMLFYLQDASNEATPSLEHTLDVIRILVRGTSK